MTPLIISLLINPIVHLRRCETIHFKHVLLPPPAIAQVYNDVWNGIGEALDDLSISNATIYGDLETLGTSITKCTDGIVERMTAFIEQVRHQIGTCLG